MIALALRYWWAIAIAGLCIALALSHAQLSQAHREFSDYRLSQQEARILADRANRRTEQTWQDAANQSLKDKDEAILNINARLADVTGRLSDRPTRPAVQLVPSGAVAVASGTGAGLYRDDGIFLVGFAASAAKVAAERDQCYALNARLSAAAR